MISMSRSTIAAYAVLVIGKPCAWAADNANPQQEVDKAVHEVVAAYSEGAKSLDRYFSFYADDISIIRGPQGRYTKTDYYKHWKDVNEHDGGVSNAELLDLRIQVSPSGDAAVTTYLMPVTRKFPKGVVPLGEESHVTWNMSEVWFKLRGKWVVTSLCYVMAAPKVQ